MQTPLGECVLDTTSRQLLEGTNPVHLSRKAFELLAFLVESGPRALSKSEILRRLWPDTFVVEANLSNLVAEVRTALGDDPKRPRFIRTVHGFGYAFLGGGDPAPARPVTGFSYFLLYKGRRIGLSEGSHLLGRDPASIVPLDSKLVSRRHATVRVTRGEAFVEDLGSKNGTYLRGTKVVSPMRLGDGDVIRVGRVLVKFLTSRHEEDTEADLSLPSAHAKTRAAR